MEESYKKLLMEDDLKRLQVQDNIIILVNGRHPQDNGFAKWKWIVLF
jgi:hypothetical protein